MSVDFVRAQLLLDVSKNALGYPNLKWLVDAAAEELEKLNPAPKPAPEKVLVADTPAPKVTDRVNPPNEPGMRKL